VDFGISIITTEDSNDTADLLYTAAKREQRRNSKEVVLRGSKSKLSTSDTMQFIVEGFPNVSAVIAKRLLSHFGSIRALASASEKELQEVHGVGKKIASSIYSMINKEFSLD
ncbi:MAG: DEAD/DEAH box helicase, partial [Candidatus Heimdallarchaeota archaeon]|nr:DEAD/DEAH box helicase [Candidatus Heimdallarchaeota archaeon]